MVRRKSEDEPAVVLMCGFADVLINGFQSFKVSAFQGFKVKAEGPESLRLES